MGEGEDVRREGEKGETSSSLIIFEDGAREVFSPSLKDIPAQ